MELEQHTFDLAERVRILRRIDSILVEGRIYALAWYKPYTRIAYWDRFGHPDYYLGRFSEWEAALVVWWVDPKKARMVDRAWRGEQVTMPAGEMEVRFWPVYNAAHPFGGDSKLW